MNGHLAVLIEVLIALGCLELIRSGLVEWRRERWQRRRGQYRQASHCRLIERENAR